MSLCTQLEALPGPQYAHAGLPKPRLREIQSPLTWVSCFLAYAAVLTPDPRTRDLLAYGRLIIREAQRHGGPGWHEYDKIFRQQAALDKSVKWNELNPNLLASTVLTFRSGPGKCCGLCHEPDHDSTQCATLVLQSQSPATWSPHSLFRSRSSPPRQGGPIHRYTRPETMERICVSWNRGRCSFPTCSFRPICATCKRRGHKAKDCEDTPAESHYKTPPSQASNPPRKARGSSPSREA